MSPGPRPAVAAVAIGLVLTLAAAACAPPPPAMVGGAVEAQPVGTTPPAHPFMADTAANSMHGDAANTDAHEPVGPLGAATTIDAFDLGGLCAGQAFDRQGRVVTVCGSVGGFLLHVIDPATMRPIATLALPQRPSTPQALLEGDLSLIFTDTSGGAYFYLDEQDRIVLVDAEQQLRVIELREGPDGARLVDVARHRLEGYLVERDCFSFPWNVVPAGRCDVVTSVMPDWSGRYWFVSRLGIVGVVDPVSGAVRTVQLHDEEIENSMAVDRDAVYVVSDRATYSYEADDEGAPTLRWREEYDRSGGPRPGQLALGSGTTPTLVGDGLLAIADGADPVNVVVMRTGATDGEDRTMCQVPVFDAGASAVENSLVTDGHAVTVQNTYGYADLFSLPPGSTVPGGVAKVDIDEAAGTCSLGWSSDETVPSSAMKLSRGAGLLYGYAKVADDAGRDLWYWTALDWRSGELAHRVLAGVGPQWNNNWGVISIGPAGAAYVGTVNGLVRVADG